MLDLVLLFISWIGTIAIFALIVFRSFHSTANRFFALFNLTVTLWTIANYFSLHATGDAVILFWIRATMALAIWQSVFLFLFACTFPKGTMTTIGRWLWLILCCSLLTSVIAFTPLIFSSLLWGADGLPEPVPGIGMLLFVPNSIGLIFASILILGYKRRKAGGAVKNQLGYLLLGSVSTYVLLILLHFVSVVFFHDSSFIKFGPIFTFPFIFLTAYAITRHRLLDIRMAIRKTALYGAIIAMSCSLLFASIFIADRYFGIVGSYAGFALGSASMLAILLLAFGLWLRFKRYPKILRNYTTLADELQGAADTTLQQFDPKNLLVDLQSDLSAILPSVTVDLYLWDFIDHIYFSTGDEMCLKLSANDVLIHALYRRHAPLWLSALQQYAGEFEGELASALKKSLSHLKAEAILPLFAGTDLISFLVISGSPTPPSGETAKELEKLLADYRQAIVYLLSYQQSIARGKGMLEKRES